MEAIKAIFMLLTAIGYSPEWTYHAGWFYIRCNYRIVAFEDTWQFCSWILFDYIVHGENPGDPFKTFDTVELKFFNKLP